MITIAELPTVLVVVRHRHSTRVAKELFVTQPSVSYQVREPERVLEFRLIEVVGRRVCLTDADERLAERATGLLNELEDLDREMHECGAGPLGRLRAEASRTLSGYAMPEQALGPVASDILVAIELVQPEAIVRAGEDGRAWPSYSRLSSRVNWIVALVPAFRPGTLPHIPP